MKKRIIILVSVCTCIIGILFAGLIGIVYLVVDYFALISPIPYSIYVNGEKIDGITAYMYEGYIFVPVLGMMELYGYDVNRAPGQDPEFVIDGEVYKLDIEEKKIYNGAYCYLGDVVGGRCFIDVVDTDVYTLLIDLDLFFECIGKDPVKADKIGIDYWNKRVGYEINYNNSTS